MTAKCLSGFGRTPECVSGTPGLWSQGGAIGGGLPLSRPDLHFLYNIVETAPLVAGFFGQVSQEAWRLRRATPP
jgi:hypothetical protein